MTKPNEITRMITKVPITKGQFGCTFFDWLTMPMLARGAAVADWTFESFVEHS